MKKGKKLISAILIMSLLISLFLPLVSKAYDDNVKVTLSSDATELVAGTQITLNINMELTDKSVDTFSAILKYDTSVLSFNLDNEFSTTAETKWSSPEYNDNDGEMQIESTRSSGNSGKSGVMFTCTFDVLQTVARTQIELEDNINCAYMGEDIWCAGDILSIPNTAQTYTISYNPNTTDIVNNMPSVGTKIEGIDYTIANAPQRTGYTFAGWNTSADGNGTTYEAGSTYSTEAKLDLYAKWNIITTTLVVNPNGGIWDGSSSQQTFTQGYETTKTINDPTTTPNGNIVRFNPNGGTTKTLQITQTTSFSNWNLIGGGSLNDKTYTFSDTTATLKAQYTGNSITLPEATKTGTNFLGWYTETVGGDKIGEAGETYTPTSATTLFAHWDNINYTLTVDPNNGSWNGTTQTSTVNGTYNSTTQVTNPIAPDGYTVTLDNNDGTNTTSEVVQTKTFDKWTLVGAGTINGTTYTYGADNGTLTATYIENNVSLTNPTRTGYTFDGWYTEATNGTKIETPYMPTSDITLYAHWTANKYKVTFNAGEEGTVDTKEKEVIYDEAYGTLPTPTREGYDFEGWYDENNQKVEETDVVKITTDKVLTAKWLGATYTITFDYQEGIGSETTREVRNEGTYGELPKATKEGYTCKGWYTEATEGEKIEGTTTVNLTQNQTLYAQYEIITTTLTVNPNGGKWEENTETQTFTQDYGTTKEISNPTENAIGYTVTLDNNDGTNTTSEIVQTKTFDRWTLLDESEFTGTTYTFSTTNETLTAQYTGNSITLPEAIKTGANFLGWYTAAVGGDKVGEAGEDYTPTSATTLYAQWENINYTLTVDPNGGTWKETTETSTETGIYNSTKTIENPIAPDGYTVTLDNNDGTNTTSKIVQTKTFGKWTLVGAGTINGTTYTYGANNGTLTATYTDNNVSLTNPTRAGYTFDGWYTEATNGTKIETPYMPTSDITLYAHWTANKYKVTFDAGEGTVDTTEKEVIYNETYGTLPTPTREGYDFECWYDENNQKVEETDIVKITTDKVLTAKWIGATYTVTFDYQGGTGDITSKDVQNEGTYETLPEATKTGYTFKGWYTEKTSGTKIENTTIVNLTSDITVYAQYEVNKYNVIFYNNDGTTILEKVEVEYGGNATFSGENPKKVNVKAGYKAEFIGWNTETTNITKETSVIAQYKEEPITYTIEYKNTKDSNNSSNPTSYTVEDEKIELKELPNQNNLIFKGWYTTEDKNGEKITSIDTSKLENIILYAQWEEDKLYLESEKYKIGENDIDRYEENDVYFDKIEPKTTVKTLMENCETNGTISIITKDGQTLTDEDIVGTGMTIKVKRNDQEINLILVVMGDLDGNGLVTATDLSTINQVVLKILEIKDEVFKAADLDDNNKLTATDLSTINQTVLKIIQLTYDKTQNN